MNEDVNNSSIEQRWSELRISMSKLAVFTEYPGECSKKMGDNSI